ncbi:ubiquinol-cytochrome c reductase cytochrome b subunit [Corynebacterium pilosum]|uniref:Ubiquinol-cytochrome c reductase cytochrome b subunit n=1 Tax=Corynebacterium pilosum TaxID=35756 RepID=A0A376GUE0_9CORY|nr:ubiquinol-cytochrome c reductase cytochrome b subunit [Corynebacterium pilosum]
MALIMVVLLFAYPWIEKKSTGDNAHHNLLQRPRDVPVRTGIGVMGIVFFLLLTLSGGNDLFAYHFQISLNAMTWVGRIGLIVLPPIAYFLTYRICVGLQRSDREVLEHGIETGVIKKLPNGAFVEIHQPLATDAEGNAIPLEYTGARVPKQMNQLGYSDSETSGMFKADDPELMARRAQIKRENHHEEMEALRRINEENRREDEQRVSTSPR